MNQIPDNVYKIDWVLALDANAHVAIHTDWFETLTPYKTQVTEGETGCVHGIGTVKLQVVADRIEGKCNTLVLEDVLYIPNSGYGYNMLSRSKILAKWDLSSLPEGDALLDKKRNVFAWMNHVGWWKLWLKGLPEDHTSMDTEGRYEWSATWPDRERQIWERRKHQLATMTIEDQEAQLDAVDVQVTSDEASSLEDDETGLSVFDNRPMTPETLLLSADFIDTSSSPYGAHRMEMMMHDQDTDGSETYQPNLWRGLSFWKRETSDEKGGA